MKYLTLFLLLTTGALAQGSWSQMTNPTTTKCVDTQWVTPAGKIYREASRNVPWNPYSVVDTMRSWPDYSPCGKPTVTIVLEKGCPVCGEPKKKAKCVPQYAHVACLKCGTVFSWERCE